MPAMTFVVDRRENGKTLASALKIRFGLSWSQAKRLVEGGHVRVGQQVATEVARRVKLGKKIVIAAGTIEIKKPGVKKPETGKKPTTPISRDPKAAGGERERGKKREVKSSVSQPRFDIDIVYQDDAVVVVNKPAGLTTMRHDEEAEEFGTHGQRFLTKTLAGVLPGLLGAPDRRLIAVHRLDRDTSGLVVFARNAAAAAKLTEQFRKHSVKRRYLALTRGSPQPGRIDSILVPDRGDGRRGTTRKTKPADGKRAVTHVKVVEKLGDFAAVECRLETGRTHQVRIHLGEVGTPLCGERIYDRPVNAKPYPDGSEAKRPMLHAAQLGFAHPETGQAMSWDAKPPVDFSRLWVELRAKS